MLVNIIYHLFNSLPCRVLVLFSLSLSLLSSLQAAFLLRSASSQSYIFLSLFSLLSPSCISFALILSLSPLSPSPSILSLSLLASYLLLFLSLPVSLLQVAFLLLSLSLSLMAIPFDIEPGQQQPLSLIASLLLALAFLLLWWSGGSIAKVRRSRRGIRLPPGPRPWPIVGNLLQVGSVPHHGMRKLTEKYGPLVYMRLGSVSAVVTDSPALVREFLKKQDHVFASRPSNIASENFTYGGLDIAFSPYGPHWRNMRRLCHFELLTPRRLDSFRAGRTEELQCMVRDVLKSALESKPINLRDTFGALSSNNLTRMVLGKRFFGAGDSGPEQAAEHKAMIYEAFSLVNSFNAADYLPFLRPFDLQGHERRMAAIMRRVNAIYDAIIEEHRQKRRDGYVVHDVDSDASREAPSDFVDILLSLRDGEKGGDGGDELSSTIVKAILIDVVAAGTDTSSITSEWTMAELIRHPEIMSKVREEIELVVGNRFVEETDLPQLNYLKAVVKEVFRLHPVGAFLIPHLCMSDTKVAGYDIPKGTRVLINTYALGRNPSVWDNPLEFRPQRFMEEDGIINGHVELSDPDFRIVPFGAGRRGCPGASLGTSVVLLGLSRLIQSFSWSPQPPLTIDNMDMSEALGFMTLANPLLAVPTPLLPLHMY